MMYKKEMYGCVSDIQNYGDTESGTVGGGVEGGKTIN
jgi:hypothetical protein